MSLLSNSTHNLKIRRQRFNIIEDLYLLREVVNENPFAYPYKWEHVKESICKASEKQFSLRAVRERVTYLIQLFKKKDIVNLRRSGTEEQYREKEMLLTEVISLEKNFKRTPLPQLKENENGASARGAAPALEAMRPGDDEESSMNSPTISKPSTPLETGITNTVLPSQIDERMDREVPLVSPPTPRGSKRKRSSLIQYLEKKLLNEMQLEEKRLRLEQEKLQFEKEKFEVEKCERIEAIKQLQQDREFQRQRDQQQIDLMNRILTMLEKERK